MSQVLLTNVSRSVATSSELKAELNNGEIILNKIINLYNKTVVSKEALC